MKELIQKALEENNTTIVPNFGAFMKMGKSVLFNEFLKYDDGKLIQFYADAKKVSVEEAKLQIEVLVKEIQSSLDAGESIEFVNVGVISKEAGKIKFTVGESGSLPIPTSEAPKEVIKEEAKVEIVVPEKTVEKIVEKDEPILKVTEPEKPVVAKSPKKPINISTDFSAQDAIEKIKSFTNKSDLLDFTREDKRKTVIDALNKKLDGFNGKTVTEIEKEEKEIPVIIPVVEKAKVPEKPIVKVEKEVIEEEKPILEEKTKKIIVEEPLVSKIEEKEIIQPEVKVEQEVVLPKKEVKIEVKKTDLKEEEAIAAIVQSVDKTEGQLKKRKRRRLVLWMSILCLLIGGGIFSYLNLDTIKSYFEKKHEPKELTDNTEKNKEESGNENKETSTIKEDAIHVVPVVDTVKEEAVPEVIEVVPEVKEEIIEKPVKTEIVTTGSSSSGNYHIVAGSFSAKENAENKVAILKSKGYNDAKILGLYGGLYTVRAMSFNSNSEAKTALVKFKDDGNKGFVKKL